ncbi:hypothetical protein CYLTODRAFT_411251 [Cylindrobasidium torrendii FP15055 ss-10]|uniref:Uncharacterized protein n=1 Tax=Cylindrobasidium torrendii FP15055 ss-10 TaxID=1314674 RepID=A0A0D7BAP6_9AGAR|nr:hypothetical protein CYLTODRAFT_411251 [Cylindrobasidium torrendii FP15055 ss-10]
MALLPSANLHLRELYETTIEFFAIRTAGLGSRPQSATASPASTVSTLQPSADLQIGDIRPLTPVPDPIARLTRECASLREKLDAQAFPASSSISSPMSHRRDLEETRRELSVAKKEASKLEARCRMLEKMLKDTKTLLKARDAEIARAARSSAANSPRRRDDDRSAETATPADEERASTKSIEVFMTRTDSWSGAQLLQAVQDLNSEIVQFAAAATELSTFDKPPSASTSKSMNQAVQETASRLGPNLARILSTRDHSQDPMLVQLALQGCISTCVARALTPFCMGFPSKPDGILSQIYAHMYMAESQPMSSRWRALTHRHIHTMYPYLSDYSVNELSETMYRWTADILYIAGCPTTDRTALSSREGMRTRFAEQISRIAKTVARLAQVTREEIMSTRFEIIAVENDGAFDARRMCDAFGEYGSSRGSILITTEVGLRCNTRRDSTQSSSTEGTAAVHEIEQRILLQPKVVLDTVVDLL